MVIEQILQNFFRFLTHCEKNNKLQREKNMPRFLVWCVLEKIELIEPSGQHTNRQIIEINIITRTV